MQHPNDTSRGYNVESKRNEYLIKKWKPLLNAPKWENLTDTQKKEALERFWCMKMEEVKRYPEMLG